MDHNKAVSERDFAMDLLEGVTQGYDWGDRAAIPALLGRKPSGNPEAEYWLGAHPNGPAKLVERTTSLDEVIAADTLALLGDEITAKFGQLPYLLKILAADKPLSIQAHPSLTQAAAGFEREEKAGLDRKAPNRSYRDANHKPELICALTRFQAKCGFKPADQSAQLFRSLRHSALQPVAERLSQPGEDAAVLADTVGWLLRMPPEEASRLATALNDAVLGVAADARTPELDWTRRIFEVFRGDVGVVVALLLNHVVLQPGEAVFLGAGNMHCYLSGVGVELMANSDNVLRGGLTSKFVDVDELLANVNYEPSAAPVQTADSHDHSYDIPVPEFGLTRWDSSKGPLPTESIRVNGPEIVLVTAGSLRIESGSSAIELGQGAAGFIAHSDTAYSVTDRSAGSTVAWRATVGKEQ